MAQRRTDLDALRSFAMLLGVALHASLSLSRRLATEEAAGTKDAFYGRTPLGWATLQGDPAMVAAVLDAGADANEHDGSGNTALHVVAFFGHDAAGRGRWWLVAASCLPQMVIGMSLAGFYGPDTSLGLIGVFHRFFRNPSPTVSWLADASYWMYLIHVPLVMVAQLLVRQWPLPANVKFLLILAMVTPIMLATYRWCVRFTPIGSLLNGPRDRRAIN